jgi:hypothetical protein
LTIVIKANRAFRRNPECASANLAQQSIQGRLEITSLLLDTRQGFKSAALIDDIGEA